MMTNITLIEKINISNEMRTNSLVWYVGIRIC